MESFVNWFKYDLLKLQFLASEHGERMDNMMVYVHWLMGALFVGWLAFFLYAVFRFSAKRNPKASYAGVQGHTSSYLEVVVACFEAVLLIGFAVPLWASVVTDPPPETESTVVRILGQQFNWWAHYGGPDGVMGAQKPDLSTGSDPFGVDRMGDTNAVDDVVVQRNIVVPVGVPVICHISSLDVIHSFDVHAMRICQDAIPGMSIPVWFKPTKVGEYMVTCAQLCGNGHYNMAASLKVVSQAEYERWLLSEEAPA